MFNRLFGTNSTKKNAPYMKHMIICATTIMISLLMTMDGSGSDCGNYRHKAGNSFTTGEYAILTDYASYKEGSDWAPALKRALADYNQIYVPPGNYFCSEITLPSNSSIVGASNETVFLPLSDHLFVIEGKIGAENRIAHDIKDFSNTILLDDSNNLAVGDDILIQGQRNSMLREGIAGINYNPDWVLGRTRKSSCFFGEMDVITSVEGSKITTRNNRIFPDYFNHDRHEPQNTGAGFLRRDATTVSKLSMAKNVTLRNISINGTAECFMPIKLYYSKDCLLENITFNISVESFKPDGKEDLSIVYGLFTWNTVVRNCKAILSPELLIILDAKEKAYVNFSNYNLFKMISSNNSGFENCFSNGGSHAFNITRSASPKGRGGIPSVNCFIRNCTALNCIWSGVTVQQGCYNTELSGNIVLASGQGIITGGRKTTIINNMVDTNLPYSTNYYYTEISRGGTLGIGIIEGAACGSTIRNNSISNFYTGIGVIDGYEMKNCFEEGNISIENNTISECLRGFTLYKNSHCETLGQNDLKIVIRGNTFTRTKPQTLRIDSINTDTYGIYLPNMSAGISIKNNVFNQFTYGVWMDRFVNNISITNNRIENNYYGMALTDIPNNINNFTIHIHQSDNTFISTPVHTKGFDQPKVSFF